MNIINPYVKKGMLLGVTINSPDINSATNIVMDAIMPNNGMINMAIIRIIRRTIYRTESISATDGVFTYLSHIIADKRINGKI